MKIEELKNKLNKKLKVLIGKKLSYGAIHNNVREITEEIFKEIGIGNLKYSMWGIDYIGDNNLQYFKLKVTTEDDKRYRTRRIGKILKIFFVFPDKFKDMTLEEIKTSHNEEKRKDTIRWLKKAIIEKQEDIKRYKKGLKELGVKE